MYAVRVIVSPDDVSATVMKGFTNINHRNLVFFRKRLYHVIYITCACVSSWAHVTKENWTLTVGTFDMLNELVILFLKQLRV